MSLNLIIEKINDKKITKQDLKTINKLLNLDLNAKIFSESVPKIVNKINKKLDFSSINMYCAGIKGRRDYMEDKFSLYFINDNIFSGIFDGHGGDKCSTFFNENYIKVFYEKLSELKNTKKALIQTIKDLNLAFLKTKTKSGSTVNIFFIELLNKKIHNINLGDSRSMIGFTNNKARAISRDHKPELKTEKKYIESKGGSIRNGRVQGILAMSRAVGDKDISEFINDTPNYFTIKLTNRVKYLLNATDGLFDVLTVNEINAFIINLLKDSAETTETIVRKLILHAYDKDSHDNISASLIIF